MALSKHERDYLKAIMDMDAVKENTDQELAMMTSFKLQAIQARQLSAIAEELGNIAAAIERRPRL